MKRSDDLRRQLRAAIKASPYKTQGRVARALGITPQTLNDVLGGKRPILNATHEGALEVLGYRVVIKPLKHDPERVHQRL
ncbi:MAG: hypothetical protein SFU83_17850 [Meiothermus sp.]|nr:hypothetical protein [Meiothermus sp.]